MSDAREKCLANLIEISKCNVVLVTKDNLNKYILPDHPLHPAYFFLSETHKADFLRTYFMNFHGGGYSDIKRTTGSWIPAFESLRTSDKWMCGYAEIPGGVAYAPHHNKWRELIGNGAYIAKSQTPLTQEWYAAMMALLDTKFEQLKLNPAKGPQDCAPGSGYPIEWNEMLGRIFHKVAYKYKDNLLNTLPISIFHNYR